MRQYKYIFWDLDGTITNTMEGIRNCLNYALEKYNIVVTDPNVIRTFIGPPLRVYLPEYFGLNPEETEEAVVKYRERYIPIGVYECELFPDVPETIAKFHEAGCVQVLTSSKPEPQCHQVLSKFDLEDKLDHIVGASLDGKIDSKIQVLNEAFRRLKEEDPDFDKSQVVLIGDTKYDADGAAEAGIECIGITYGFGTAEELREHGVTQIYDTLEEVTRALIGV